MMKNKSVKLDDATQERLNRIAQAKNQTPHKLMNEAVIQYLDQEEREQKFVRQAIASWEHYKESGLHLSSDEVDQWLLTYGTDEESELPECHK